MTPTYQKFKDDCVQAALASIFDLRYDAVPYFHSCINIYEQMDKIEQFANTLGYYTVLTNNPSDYNILVSYHKPAFNKAILHARVAYHNHIIFDPAQNILSWNPLFSINFTKVKPKERQEINEQIFFKSKSSRLLGAKLCY